MKLVIDIETDRLVNPRHLWCVVCKDIDTGDVRVFKEVTSNELERQALCAYLTSASLVVGHNLLGFDLHALGRLVGIDCDALFPRCCDTLVLSRLIDFSRDGHSIEDYGLEFGYPKGNFTDFAGGYSEEMLEYCRRDVEICHKIYLKYLKYISNKEHSLSIDLEHWFQWNVINSLETKGFYFNTTKALSYLDKVTKELSILDKDILEAFPKKLKLIREITPKATKYGTISLSSIPKVLRENISEYSVDAPFSYCKWVEFNPSSHKQIIEVLNGAGWSPVDKTKTHLDTEREFNKLKNSRQRGSAFDIRRNELYNALSELQRTGWKVNENNLDTLPKSAPASARTLAKRILYESRRRTLTEWLALADKDTSRIHGRFQAIGTWTHRMATQKPNTQNIPNEFDTEGRKKLLGKELRSLWCAPKNRLLVGVDAEGIQLRIFAHYINDPEFTHALVNGKKEDKSDAHNLNQRILGSVCKSRSAAKRFIFAYLLGAGIGKLAQILVASEDETKDALGRLTDRYAGLQVLKETIIPSDARRGWFVGLDGRRVAIVGDTEGTRRHLCMSGYLQNGEAVVMKHAVREWWDRLPEFEAFLVNFVHDEWQTECPNNMAIALEIAKLQADSLRIVGEKFKLNCPLAGSYYNDDIQDYTIATNWAHTH